MEVASDQELWELKKKVIIIVTTVEKNRDRLQVIREAIKDDEWARDLFVFISDVSHPEEEDVLTYPGECNQTKWLPAKCCRFKKWYFETWEQQYPEVEWVFKADDDTYVNARNLLLAIASFGGSGHNSTVARTQPVFLGHRSHPNPDYNAIPNMWPHGGGGWLINRATIDLLKTKEPLKCSEYDDVDFGHWVQAHGLPITPYGGISSWVPFKKGQPDETFLVEPVASFACIVEDVVRLPYYPITFHKRMQSFPQLAKVMRSKRFALIDLPPLRPEDRGYEGKSDNYERRLLPWLRDMADPATTNFTLVDCASVFDFARMSKLGESLELP